MARKDLLKGLMEGKVAGPVSVPARSVKGAIGAVGQSIADLKARSIIEVPVDKIDTAGLKDRLDEDAEGIAALAVSIAEYGQQVPVLLRHSSDVEGRYEVVYGRRRVLALKQLGQPVKAMLREMNDRELVIAQGQENSARKDLSFIEKANFARQMVAMGFERKVVCDALSIDKTLISRMLSVADGLPLKLIEAIGAAPSIGRERWQVLLGLAGGRGVDELVAMAVGATSNERFDAVMAGLAVKPAPVESVTLTGSDGRALGLQKRAKNRVTLVLDGKADEGFGSWLADNISEIHRDFLRKRGE